MITLQANKMTLKVSFLASMLSLTLGFGQSLMAQTANIKDIPVDPEQGTTIRIEKGARPNAPTTSEVLEGQAEVTGDPKPLARVARESWSKACEDWKKEVKELNKDNQIMALSCNSAKCSNEGVLTVCKSTATYKIRMKIQ